MNKDLHDLKNHLKRLEIMGDLLVKKDFEHFTKEELAHDARESLLVVKNLLDKMLGLPASSDQ